MTTCSHHDDVIKWKHFPRYWPFVRGIHRSSVNFPHKGQWRGTSMFSLICPWTNGWVNNRDAGPLWRHRVHYDVTVMQIGIQAPLAQFTEYFDWKNTDLSTKPGDKLFKYMKYINVFKIHMDMICPTCSNVLHINKTCEHVVMKSTITNISYQPLRVCGFVKVILEIIPTGTTVCKIVHFAGQTWRHKSPNITPMSLCMWVSSLTPPQDTVQGKPLVSIQSNE